MVKTKGIKAFGKKAYLALTGGVNRTTFDIHGVQVFIPAHIDPRIRYFIARGRYENREAELIRQHLCEGDTVIELGGALGVISKVIRDQIGDAAQHIVVEPNPAVLDTCKINAGHSNTKVVQAAIAYGQTEVLLSQDASLLDNRLVEHPKSGQLSFSAPTTSLAALHDEIQQKRFKLVCDIEGAEGDLVRFDAETLSYCDSIIMEVHAEYLIDRGTTLEEMINQFKALDFKVISMEGNALYLSR
ncbi:FkbM family methyltransferase [Litoreibacter albidus]|uniref:FkbM family methyltransferase n=1 Tax=Litoreibacter albidus TaxID=670155 RepID=UPI003736CF3F